MRRSAIPGCFALAALLAAVTAGCPQETPGAGPGGAPPAADEARLRAALEEADFFRALGGPLEEGLRFLEEYPESRRAAEMRKRAAVKSLPGNAEARRALGLLEEGKALEGELELPADTYRISRTLRIAATGTLRLAAGTILEFLPGAGLVAHGRLQAAGSPGAPVFFTAFDKRRGFDNVTFAGPSAGGELRHCVFTLGTGADPRDPAVSGGLPVEFRGRAGGGAAVLGGASPVFEKCLFKNNGALCWGGGVFSHASAPRFSDCNFSMNSSLSGGGAFVARGSAVFAKCVFEKNRSAAGAGVFCSAAEASFEGCRFKGNRAARGAGAAFAAYDASRFLDCEFSANIALVLGGGLFAQGPCSTGLSRCRVVENACELSGDPLRGGGGIFCAGKGVEMTLEDCAVSSNRSRTFGGGLACPAGSIPRFTRVRIESNRAERGGGIFLFGPKKAARPEGAELSGNRPEDLLSGDE